MRRAILPLLMVGSLAASPGQAQALAINVQPVTLGTLVPGQTTVSPAGSVVVTGALLTSWTLRVDDGTGSSTPGHLVRAGAAGACASSAASLASPLHISTAGPLPSTVVDRPEYDLASLSNPVIAHGTLADTLTVRFSQAVGSGEQLAPGCSYSATVVYTVTGS